MSQALRSETKIFGASLNVANDEQDKAPNMCRKKCEQYKNDLKNERNKFAKVAKNENKLKDEAIRASQELIRLGAYFILFFIFSLNCL
jgi:hypothetical protein